MSSILKFIIVSFIVLVALVFAVVLVGNFYFTVGSVETSTGQVSGVSEELVVNDAFIARSYSYEERLVFSYVPRDPDETADYYADYEVKRNGNTIAAGDHRPYRDISADNPIILEVPRERSSVYELDMSIEDDQGNLVHSSSVSIESQDK